MRGNPNPKQKLKPLGDKALSSKIVGVKLPIELDEYVRSRPNMSEWLRRVISEAISQEIAEAEEQQKEAA